MGFVAKAVFSGDQCFDFTFMSTHTLHTPPPPFFCIYRNCSLNWAFSSHFLKKGFQIRERRQNNKISAFGYVQIVSVVFFSIKIANN